ncbi:MAG TPA: DUF488 family protein [Spirochaetia bacterium]|nr:DUF488 family protein [Spirochaetia bacterium]
MAISVVRLGTPRGKNEGMRVGTVRRPPRGVKKTDYARLDFYDVWLPQLAPSATLVSWIKGHGITPANWKQFQKQYLRELASPDSQRLLDLLAALSRDTDFAIGCFCENENECHRSILRAELEKRGAVIRK